MSADPSICHSCDLEITGTNESPIGDTCDTCLTECLCFLCREARWQIGEDRMEQVAFDAWREGA